MANITRLRYIRLARGMTQTALAEKAGIARPYLSQLESGLKSGSVDTLKTLAKVLGVTTDDLIADTDSVPEFSAPRHARAANSE